MSVNLMNYVIKSRAEKEEKGLFISEFFMDTIQGENFVGTPSVFLRLGGCHLKCVFCDTEKIWKHSVCVTIESLIRTMVDQGVVERLKKGHHLVITGGSPLLQQEMILLLMRTYFMGWDAREYFIELENECTIPLHPSLEVYFNRINNSPKLANCGQPKSSYYRPDVVRNCDMGKNWFKFVIQNTADWEEIEELYIKTNLIPREKIVLMPMGCTREEIKSREQMVVALAVKHSVRYSPRLHIDIWDNKTGV